MRLYHNEEGVSEITSTALLIGVTILLVAILAAIFLSGLQPDEIPRAAIYARNESSKFALAHMGGDPLKEGNYRVYIDTGNGLMNATGDFTRPEGGVWSVGESIAYNKGSWTPGRVVVTVISGETEMILAEMGLSGGMGVPTPPETPTTTPPETPTATPTETPTATPTPPPGPVAVFTADITVGNAPLEVPFTDESTGGPTDWLWDFGDGGASTEQSPTHTYTAPGSYTVSLTASNAHDSDTCTKSDYIRVTEKPFIDYVIDENVFVYGTYLNLEGSASVTGDGATVVVTEGLSLGGNGGVAVSNIYVDSSVTLSSGNANFGSDEEPGKICINGDLTITGGNRGIYGDVYVDGNCHLESVKIYGNVSVNGDLNLDDVDLVGDGHIYYTGSVSGEIPGKCIHQSTVPGFSMPDLAIPPAKPDEWYVANGYVGSTSLSDNKKIFVQGSISTSGPADNVIIVARNGDITIDKGKVTGIFFAPNGKVTFRGKILEGVVIAHGGLSVERGGKEVTFRNIDQYITNPADYPF